MVLVNLVPISPVKDKFSIEVKENPLVEDLKELLTDENFHFKFNV